MFYNSSDESKLILKSADGLRKAELKYRTDAGKAEMSTLILAIDRITPKSIKMDKKSKFISGLRGNKIVRKPNEYFTVQEVP